MKEQRILEGKLPTIDSENFGSANNIVGARVKFIDQLRRSSKEGLNPRYDDPQSLGQQDAMPRNFKQIISDAKQSANSTNLDPYQPNEI